MEPDRRIRRVAVVGGGIEGWTAAALLNRKLGGQCSIHVVDTPETMSPGHAQATLPSIHELVRFLGVDQNEFVDSTQSTYSLGTRFDDWNPGKAFWHPFGAFGALIERRPFYHFWHKARAQGLQLKIEQFSQEICFSQANRFIFPTNTMNVAPQLRYSMHLDMAAYTRLLRILAERGGVIRLERKVLGATRREDGSLDELKFEDGGTLRADLFIDCTGSRAQLLGETLGVRYLHWTDILPCDRVLSVPGALTEARAPFVQNRARRAGWQWRMALQQVVSHGLVYASDHQSDDEARQALLADAGELQGEPVLRRFTSGRRERVWDKNVIAIGSAAGNLDPLAAADQHLLANAMFNLLDHFPAQQFDANIVDSYNKSISDEVERIRDFTVLHYHLTRRKDSPFWQSFAGRAAPDLVARRVALYEASGRILLHQPELFNELDWFWILEGMGAVPRDYDPLIDSVDFEQVKKVMVAIAQQLAHDTNAAPTHDSFFVQANARLARARKGGVAVG